MSSLGGCTPVRQHALAGVNHTDVDAAVLSGKQPERERAAALEAFRRGEARVLISKASLIGFGLNFQFCRSMVFSGFDDSFERLYQAIRRSYRYGQTETVRVHLELTVGGVT